MSNVPPASPRRRQGRLAKMTKEAKAKRLAKRERKKNTHADWRGRVWAHRHINK